MAKATKKTASVAGEWTNLPVEAFASPEAKAAVEQVRQGLALVSAGKTVLAAMIAKKTGFPVNVSTNMINRTVNPQIGFIKAEEAPKAQPETKKPAIMF